MAARTSTPVVADEVSASLLVSLLNELSELSPLLGSEDIVDGHAESNSSLPDHALDRVDLTVQLNERVLVGLLGVPGCAHLGAKLSELLALIGELFPHFTSERFDVLPLLWCELQGGHDSRAKASPAMPLSPSMTLSPRI